MNGKTDAQQTNRNLSNPDSCRHIALTSLSSIPERLLRGSWVDCARLWFP
jgi:hypothetical protein